MDMRMRGKQQNRHMICIKRIWMQNMALMKSNKVVMEEVLFILEGMTWRLFFPINVMSQPEGNIGDMSL